MPSREEIVSWIRGAAGGYSRMFKQYHKLGWDDHKADAKIMADKFEQRAAQVASMRCETCKKDAVYIGIDEWMACPWRNSGGCFSHEPKEIK